MNKQTLSHYYQSGNLHVSKGTIIRYPFEYRGEIWRNVMVYDCALEGQGMGLVVITGYYAGTPTVYLPEESGKRSISTNWLVNNFTKWVEDAPLEQVFIIEKIMETEDPFS
ncbi:Imm45 family immunity protein [Mesorhizobium huakuii]|uniref:Imm45 family immunity protein n=1 Tax=Mesorhizobium huakuii TaxID=28104 RepID=A0ABZ0VIX0_9HYPH|nr:Imm45 family immunity protein [Mesorhizobium huakuii]WQB97382.1 Imm45 family immunity protein [Mesorhizobium huakuii]